MQLVFVLLDKALLIVMAKWHAYGRCKNRLSKDIGKICSANVQRKMTGHTISVAKSLEKKGLIEISLAISGLGFKKSKRWLMNYCLLYTSDAADE